MKPKSVATDCTPEKLGMGAMSGKDYGKYGHPAMDIEIDEDGLQPSLPRSSMLSHLCLFRFRRVRLDKRFVLFPEPARRAPSK